MLCNHGKDHSASLFTTFWKALPVRRLFRKSDLPTRDTPTQSWPWLNELWADVAPWCEMFDREFCLWLWRSIGKGNCRRCDANRSLHTVDSRGIRAMAIVCPVWFIQEFIDAISYLAPGASRVIFYSTLRTAAAGTFNIISVGTCVHFGLIPNLKTRLDHHASPCWMWDVVLIVSYILEPYQLYGGLLCWGFLKLQCLSWV